MAVDMKAWSQGQSQDEDPVPMEELPEEQAGNLQSGSGKMSPEMMENLATLVRPHLPQIEEEVQDMEPTILLSDDQELPEDMADKIIELVDGWGDGLPEMLQGIDPMDAIAVAQMVADEITTVDPILVGAWLWRTGELT